MAKRVQHIRHSTGSANAFTGYPGEFTMDTTKKEIRVHDGLTAGGFAQARADLDNVAPASSALDGKMVAADKIKLDAIETAATQDQTGAEIKALYEAEADTNAYDNAAVAKLAGIEAGAEVNHYNSAAEIKAAYEINSNTNAFTDAEKSKLSGVQGGAVSLATVINTLYPVGSLYISTSSTNPATLLGVGTWANYGTDRVLMSAGSSHALGATGGSKDAIVVSHTHGVSGTTGNQSANHTHSAQMHTNFGTGAGETIPSAGTGTAETLTTGANSVDHKHNFSVTSGSTGSPGTNANLPPYIAVNVWRRTA